jgi:hypothetical protein
MKTLAVVLGFLVLFTLPGPAYAQQSNGETIKLAQMSRFYYVHRKSYQQRTSTSLTTCNCYSVSSSSYIFGHFSVGRYNSWDQAVAGRNAASRARGTCPGACSQPMARAGTIIRRQPGVAVRPPYRVPQRRVAPIIRRQPAVAVRPPYRVPQRSVVPKIRAPQGGRSCLYGIC